MLLQRCGAYEHLQLMICDVQYCQDVKVLATLPQLQTMQKIARDTVPGTHGKQCCTGTCCFGMGTYLLTNECSGHN